jgi:hypothetical protein
MDKPNSVEMIVKGLKEPLQITKEDFVKYKKAVVLTREGKKVGVITFSVGAFQFSAILGVHFWYDCTK